MEVLWDALYMTFNSWLGFTLALLGAFVLGAWLMDRYGDDYDRYEETEWVDWQWPR